VFFPYFFYPAEMTNIPVIKNSLAPGNKKSPPPVSTKWKWATTDLCIVKLILIYICELVGLCGLLCPLSTIISVALLWSWSYE
jgi:hypothetical protein